MEYFSNTGAYKTVSKISIFHKIILLFLMGIHNSDYY